MKAALAMAAVAAAAAIAAAGAQAITYGELDGDRHPNVGALVDPARGTYCSGTLIAPTVFLTAAHCGVDRSRVYVTFEAAPTRSSTFLAGTFHANPAYDRRQDDPGDLAVVLLDAPLDGVRPARLPSGGLLDRMKAERTLGQHTAFTVVGYGGQEVAKGRPRFTYEHRRELAVASFHALGPGYLRLGQNPATGDGGACYGDSGGPNFLGAGADETDVVVGVTVTGDTLCKATNVAQRVDTASARAFLSRYVALP